MKKFENSANNIKVAKKYYLHPLIGSILINALLFLMILLQKNPINELVEICSTFYNIGITFSLTFTAFVITALALLQLLQSKDWFKEVSNSIYFKSFLKRFLYSVKMCVIFFISILFHLTIINFNMMLICYISLSVFLFCLVFIVLWIFACISDFIILFR
jgi:hypothetical protein